MIEYRTLIGGNAKPEEVDTFVNLVKSGGAVDEIYVRKGVVRPGAQLTFAEDAGQTVGVAALKVPSHEYRSGLQSAMKAYYSLPDSDYPYELGYVSVSHGHLGKGIAKALVAEVMRLADGNGIFATTSNQVMKVSVLPSSGFQSVGKTWANTSGGVLGLWVRKSQKK